MIKLIACDIDGTLLPYGETEISPETFDEIKRILKKGIAFCPASGRQYTSLRSLFAPVADDIYYLCENGAAVYDKGKEKRALCKIGMSRADVEELIDDILALDDCEVLICGDDISYLIPKKEDIVYRMKNFTGNNVAVITSPDEIKEDIVKVSAYVRDGKDLDKLEKSLGAKWAALGLKVAVAGEEWLDFTIADKGIGIAHLCKALGIDKKDVMAFGDNYNDLPMLKEVGTPYVMENAVTEIKEMFKNHCKCVNDVLKLV